MKIYVDDEQVFGKTSIALKGYIADLKDLFDEIKKDIQNKEEQFEILERKVNRKLREYYYAIGIATGASLSAPSVIIKGLGVISLAMALAKNELLLKIRQRLNILKGEFNDAKRRLEKDILIIEEHMDNDFSDMTSSLENFNKAISKYLNIKRY